MRGSQPSVPELSVIVPVRNEGRYIDTLLSDLVSQNLSDDDYEILVVDGSSEDDTRQRILRHVQRSSNIRLLNNPATLSAAARNVGLRNARGHYFLFVDGHCRIPSSSMLRTVLAAFNAGADCVSRPQPLIAGESSAKARAIVATRNSILGHMPASRIFDSRECEVDPTSAGCGYTRHVVDRVGFYDETFDAVEDVDYNNRVMGAGFLAHHSPGHAVAYVARDSWRALGFQMFRYGLGRSRLWRKSPSWQPTVAMLPAVWLVTMLLAFLISAWQPWASWFALAGLTLPSVLVSCATALQTPGDRVITATMAVPSLLTILFGAGLGVLKGMAEGSSGEAEVHVWAPK